MKANLHLSPFTLKKAPGSDAGAKADGSVKTIVWKKQTLQSQTERVGEAEGGGNVTANGETTGGIGGGGRDGAFDQAAQIAGADGESAQAVFVVVGLNVQTAVAHFYVKLAFAVAGHVKFVRINALAEVVKMLVFKIILDFGVKFLKCHVGKIPSRC